MTKAKFTPPIAPAAPRAPTEFTQEWAMQLNRWIENYTRLAAFPAVLRGGRLYLPDLPTNAYGLNVGEVFSNNGILTIIREGDAYIGPIVSKTELGTLRVTP